MERNQVIGIVLITLIMMGYFFYVGQQQPETIQKDTKDTIAAVTTQPDGTPVNDSIIKAAQKAEFGELSPVTEVTAQDIVIENEDIKVTFTSEGGIVKNVLLKKYFADNHQPLYLIPDNTNDFSLAVQTPTRTVDLYKLPYEAKVTQQGDTQTVVFTANIGENKFIQHTYQVPKTGYVVSYDLKTTGLDNIIKNEALKFSWKARLPKIEYDLEQSRFNSTVNYYLADGEFNYLTERSEDNESATLNDPVKWVSLKQKFFNTGIIANNTFEKGVVSSDVPADSQIVKNVAAELFIPIGDVKTSKAGFKYYFGPNHFQTLKEVTEDYEKNVFLGWPIIRWINRFIVIPVFNFLEQYIGNYGIIIIILVILLKLILFPLSYKSYISMAKMKVLKPELDEIKAKYGDDLQKVQQEQMQLYQKVGINPLSGCIPVLLQMPILLAMFNFFPNSIELRQESFLWAHDLSTYDAAILLPFNIPFYGSHVSLFTLLMTISTLVYTYINNQVSTVTGPMKSVSYIMPVIFLFVLNSFPAGLTFYYFMSNLITIGQQIIIRKFVDEDKIKETLEENRRKIASGQTKKSKWMLRVEEAMKAKEEAARQQQQKKKKK
ncbi:MAG TPA: membrane protein insertase YidC [Cytophagaceae bacterium]